MTPFTKEYLKGLTQLEMFSADEYSTGLIHITELENSHSYINYYQRLVLERAKKIGVDAVYFRNYSDNVRPSVPQLYIFDFTKKEKDIVEVHKNVWSSSEVRFYIIITKSEIKLFNSSKPVKINSEKKLYVSPFDILKISGEAIEKYQKYSGKKFDNGTFWEETQIDFGYSETAYEKLIIELKNSRTHFLNKIKLDKKIASKLLVLSILVKYLEEKVDLDEKGIETRVFTIDFFNKKEFGYSKCFTEVISKGYLLNLFDFLSQHFNGKIFFLSDEYKIQIKKIDLTPLANFLSGEIDNYQYVLWKLYSFNHLPIELISSIYEVFLEADKNSGIAYTPSYLVNFMVDECMPINEPKEHFKILDPACGSGIFIVSAYKRLIDWWRITYYEKTGQWIIPGKSHLNQLKKLLKESIFGIDIEGEAVDLAIFSLSLTLCNILTPKVIWENLRFDDLSNNIVESDFFEWYANDKKETFDLVIGNPPFIEWGSKFPKKNTPTINWGIQIPNNQSALLFSVQGITLVKKTEGILSFVLPSGPLLYNNSDKAVDFRKWLFSNYNIPQIIDFTYLSNVLFKNKGNEKKVAVSAFFIENKPPDEKPICHITVKKLKSARERQYFEIDHYDFHKVSKFNALNDVFVWKSNLLGGGRLNSFIRTLKEMPTLGEYLKQKEENYGWHFGEGFIIGNKKNKDLDQIIFNKSSLPTNKFTEKEVKNSDIINSFKQEFFEATRKKEIYTPPLLLIKESIGKNSIPVFFSESYLTFRNEIIGVHAPDKDTDELIKLKKRIHKNQLYRFFLISTSGRAGVTKSTFPIYKQDIMNLPFPKNESELELTEFEEILLEDTLTYSLEFLGKDTNIRSLNIASKKEIISFSNIFCKVLNLLFQTKTKRYILDKIFQTESFICSSYLYGEKSEIEPEIKSVEQLEKNIAQLIHQKMGTSYRINRVVKLYDGDYIYLLKPKELRYWLKSVALRDADETIVDLYKAGY